MRPSSNNYNSSTYYNSSSYSPYGSSSYTTTATSPWSPRTSSQLRSTMSSPSTSSYVSRTHLPFVPQSTLVAHCFTGVQSSTRPYGYSPSTSSSSNYSSSGYSSLRASTSALSSASASSSRQSSIRSGNSAYTSSLSRPASTKRSNYSSIRSSTFDSTSTSSPSSSIHTSSYLSPTTYSTSASSSASSSAYRTRPLSPSIYSYRPIRLRERPMLTHIWRQINTRPSYQSSTSRAPTVDYSSQHHSSQQQTNKQDEVDVTTTKKSTEHEDTTSKQQEKSKLAPTKGRDDEWSSDITRAISRNKYIIKFREYDRRDSKPKVDLPSSQLTSLPPEPIPESELELILPKISDSKPPAPPPPIVVSDPISIKPGDYNRLAGIDVDKIPEAQLSQDAVQKLSLEDDKSTKEEAEQLTDKLIIESVREVGARIATPKKQQPKIKEMRIKDIEPETKRVDRTEGVKEPKKAFCAQAEPKKIIKPKAKQPAQVIDPPQTNIRIPIKLNGEAEVKMMKNGSMVVGKTSAPQAPSIGSTTKTTENNNKQAVVQQDEMKKPISVKKQQTTPPTTPDEKKESPRIKKTESNKTIAEDKRQDVVDTDSKAVTRKQQETTSIQQAKTSKVLKRKASITQEEKKGEESPPKAPKSDNSSSIKQDIKQILTAAKEQAPTKTVDANKPETPKAKDSVKLKLKPVKTKQPNEDEPIDQSSGSSPKVQAPSERRISLTPPESPKTKTRVKKVIKRKQSNATSDSLSSPPTPGLDKSSSSSAMVTDEVTSSDKKESPVDKENDASLAKSATTPSVDLGLKEAKSEQQQQQADSKLLKNKQVTQQTQSAPPQRIRFREYNIDDFNFLSVLGHGGWGFVILAELKQHEACFAIKCIKKITIVEDDDYESILIERKVLTLGNINPFICKLFCTFETEGYLFFVMEFCPGGDLMFHVQREGKFSEPRCRFYAAEIICAIRFLHNRHIIYRDLKLDNILLDATGHIRLVDFGMCQCRTYREEMLPSNFCGTPEYISPEIIKGVPYNHSVDWWSFGVLLYEMSVGKMPFRGNDENELLWNVCYEQIHYPLFLSRELTVLLQQLLEREPTKRMGMASCKAGDIKDQAWFKGTDWPAIEAMQVKPPFVPCVESRSDVQNFDADFTESQPELSPVDEATLAKIDQKQFSKFPYTNPDIHIFDKV